MRSIGLAGVFAGLAASLLASAPVSAAGPDWQAANSVYGKARDAAAKAKTKLDYSLCAGNWAAWDDALYDGKVAEKAVAGLDHDLSMDGADEKLNLWRLWLGNDDRSLDAFDMHREAAGDKIDQALKGDREALAGIMDTLGACQLPKDK